MDNSERETVTVTGEQGAIAYCVTITLDNEKWGIWDLPARVSRSIQSGNTTKLQSGAPSNVQTLLWEATFTQADTKTTSIEIVGRRNALASLPSSYMLDKVKKAVSTCVAK